MTISAHSSTESRVVLHYEDKIGTELSTKEKNSKINADI